ncbi:MAG: hypothetical protein WA144_13440 [Candidatus Methanoperedens sp.]
MFGANEAVKIVSKDLGINEDALIQEGIVEYIKKRIKACMRDRLEILSRYNISSIGEFETKVHDGIIPEHPGWEDLITLENLENSIAKLKRELTNVKNISLS